MTSSILRISSQSTEYYRAVVSARENGVFVNPTSGTVKFAFLAVDTDPDGSTTWSNGQWETYVNEGPLGAGSDLYKGRVLVGPGGGGTVLAAGIYDVWIRITTGSEDVMHKVGSLIVV